ncbi:patatin-like phospholipase family protein [Pedobacter sp. BS3]|uniref:patatin-like phospholipase family protein n=1 Tax=Pedobacter sp. BS3 TaxID=2567937 RepID=UPI0011EDC4E6|nr:patatin-like phospholipase family protein [Pedobacter sp. BS3]TZF84487.1 patatin-like phospholipase family protein [Pedobacter sp. BS3]
MKYVLAVVLLFTTFSIRAQKVGLVFSGGGAKGLAHIGVLKALEENHIPIDYIVGTSMGGIVGSMYAAGYSPEQIEKIALSPDFQNWVSGRFSSNYSYFFRKKPDNPSFVTAKLQLDSGFQAKIRSNLVNDIPLNFALLELLSRASATAHDNFDNLFVPYRCIVADILSQKMIAVNNGSLPEAVRGTMTVPLVYRPIKVNGRYVFDGGLYDNFPVDVMKKEFKPDYIIGTNVSSKVFNEYPKNSDERLMNRFLIYMFLSKSDSTSIGKEGTYLQPDLTDFSVANFTPVAELIKKGYDATMAEMPAIKAAVKRRTSAKELQERRERFNTQILDLQFDKVQVTGLNSKQRYYVEHVIRHDSRHIDIEDIREGYYRLVADDNFETVYPRMVYRPNKNVYDFELQAQPQRTFKVDFGGNISSRPISNAYVGLQYNYLHRKSYTFNTNFYSGRFYESIQALSRVDYPLKTPLYLEGEFTYNHWNFYSTSQIFVENVKPIYVEQSDLKAAIKAGMPIYKHGKVEALAGYINFKDKYSPNNTFTAGDILDFTRFNGFLASISMGKNTLNRKQYASAGISFQASASYYNGLERYRPGNILISTSQPEQSAHRQWFTLKASAEHYVYRRKWYTFGYLAEAVASNKPAFSNYMSTVLSAPAFYPLQDSKSLLLKNFRADSYAALGIKNVFRLEKRLDFRLEGYLFAPFKEFQLNNIQDVSYSSIFANRHYAATAGLVYTTFLGPISLSINHYDDSQKRYGVMFHIGYLLYNKRSIE